MALVRRSRRQQSWVKRGPRICRIRKGGGVLSSRFTTVAAIQNTRWRYKDDDHYHTHSQKYGQYTLVAGLSGALAESWKLQENTAIAESNGKWNFMCPECGKLNIWRQGKHWGECHHCSVDLFVEGLALWLVRRTGRVATSMIPIVGPIYKLVEGAATGDPWLVARGALSGLGDVLTLGGASVVIGGTEVAVETFLDYAPDVVELGWSLSNRDFSEAAFMTIGLSFAAYIECKNIKAGQIKTLLKDREVATKYVSNLARMVQKGGSVGKGVEIRGRWYRNLRDAAYVKRSIIEMCRDQGATEEAAKEVGLFVQYLKEIYGESDLATTLKLLYKHEINAWASKSY